MARRKICTCQYTGEPADISHFYIQTNTSKKSADADFIIFKQYGEQLQADI